MNPFRLRPDFPTYELPDKYRIMNAEGRHPLLYHWLFVIQYSAFVAFYRVHPVILSRAAPIRLARTIRKM